MNYKITRNHLLSDIPLTELLLRAEVAHVSQDSQSMVTSCLLHLSDLLPGVVLLVVLQDVCTATTSPWKYMVITKHYKTQWDVQYHFNRECSHQIRRCYSPVKQLSVQI